MRKRHGFSAVRRLKKNFEFKKVRDKGASYRDGVFVLSIFKNGMGRHRLGLSIGSAKIPLASRRNRLKRLIKEAVRLNQPALKNGPYDIVVSIRRPPGRKLNYAIVENTLLGLLRRAKAL